jgi:hypothetical protein
VPQAVSVGQLEQSLSQVLPAHVEFNGFQTQLIGLYWQSLLLPQALQFVEQGLE